MMSGIALIPVMIGLFGFPEIVKAFKHQDDSPVMRMSGFEMKKGFGLIGKHFVAVIRSAVIGVGVGIIPGVGEDTGGWLSYWASKTNSKHPDTFGKGEPLGVISTETGNNACIGGAIIPVLSLAVPGSAPAAVLLAAFFMAGLIDERESSCRFGRTDDAFLLNGFGEYLLAAFPKGLENRPLTGVFKRPTP